MGQRLGFSTVGRTRLATVASELARNIVRYAGSGSISFRAVGGEPPSVEIEACDDGPGIPNLDEILGGDYRSRSGLGLGLRGVRKLSERFEVRTAPRAGTTVRCRMAKG